MVREIKHFIYYFLLLPLLAVLPPKLCRLLIQKIIFRINLKFDYPAKKHIVLENMRRVFPDDPELGWKAEMNLAYDIFLDASTYKFLITRAAKRKNLIRAEGIEFPEQALAAKKGVILLGGHIGSFVSTILGSGIHNIPASLLVNDSPSDSELSWSYRVFARITLNTIEKYCHRPVVSFPLGKNSSTAASAVRKVNALLKSNEAIIVALDVPPYLTSSRENVHFLNAECVMPSGLVRLAQRFGTPIVTFYASWDKPFTHECTLRFNAPIFPTPDIGDNMQKCTESIEKMIRRYPDQWAHWEAFHLFLDKNPNV